MAAPEPDGTSTPIDTSQPPVDFPQNRVLIIERNEALADNLAELLETPASRPVVLSSNESIAEHLRRQAFDLALVDVQFTTHTEDVDLLATLRAASRHGEVILMTGHATLDAALEAIRTGIYALIQKPFDPDDLLALTNRALAQVALRRDKEALSDQLAASEDRYRGVVDTTPACILGLNAQGNIVLSNRFARTCVGRSARELAGQSLSHYCGETHESVELTELCKRFDHNRHDLRHEINILGVGGQRRRILWTLSSLGKPGPQSGSHDVSLLAVGQDVTEQRELERKNAESAALAAMGTLTTGLAHEIRNPLNAARLQLELLQRRTNRYMKAAEAEHIKQPASIVSEELTRLSSLLDDFLQLARPRELEIRPLSVQDILNSVRRLEEPVANNENVSLTCSVVPDDLMLHGDMDKLKQVLINLIDNSLSALRPLGRGSIRMEARAQAREAIIEVIDDGPGLPEGAAKVFQPFVSGKQMGTGLGLTIVRRIIERHGGEVTLLPNPEGGTVARIIIPTRQG